MLFCATESKPNRFAVLSGEIGSEEPDSAPDPSGEVEVPDLVGIEAIQAKTLLFNSDFLIKEFYDYDPTQPIGVVIRQAPEAGTTQTIGDSVTITINRAP